MSCVPSDLTQLLMVLGMIEPSLQPHGNPLAPSPRALSLCPVATVLPLGAFQWVLWRTFLLAAFGTVFLWEMRRDIPVLRPPSSYGTSIRCNIALR